MSATRPISTMILALLFCASALAESGNYRIEVLVFNHLDSKAKPLEFEEIRSFAAFPMLDEPVIREAPMPLEVMSSMMQDATRRLRLSSAYQPLLFASWEQSRIDYHPPVRLHDGEMIAEQLHFPYPVAFIDLRSPDMFRAYIAPYYRLDGTVQLVRSRFLHLHLDLEYRVDLLPRPGPEFRPESATITPVAETNEATAVAADAIPLEPSTQVVYPGPGPALVHTLKQSRQARTGQLQYFDTPFLGALIRVTGTTGQ